MQEEILITLIRKIAAGDQASYPALCKKLAERLLYVPSPHKEDPASENFTLPLISRDYNGIIAYPVFTSRQRLQLWSDLRAISCEAISFLAADLCQALPKGCALILDPDAPHELLLESSWVEFTAAL